MLSWIYVQLWSIFVQGWFMFLSHFPYQYLRYICGAFWGVRQPFILFLANTIFHFQISDYMCGPSCVVLCDSTKSNISRNSVVHATTVGQLLTSFNTVRWDAFRWEKKTWISLKYRLCHSRLRGSIRRADAANSVRIWIHCIGSLKPVESRALWIWSLKST